MNSSVLAKILLRIAGAVFIGLGILGIFLPLLPTTPFLLLAAACYAKSSKRLYNWLLNSKYLGKYIRNYREGKGIPFGIKIITILLLILTIGYTSIFVIHIWLVRIILFLIFVGVSIHVLSFPTLRNKNKNQEDTLMSIKILINGKEEQIEYEMSILELLKKKNIRPEVVTVELNEKIIDRKDYQTCIIKEGNKLELVYFMGGGRMVTKLVAENVLELIGSTPMVKLNKIVEEDMAEIYAKLESFNPGGSVKDRISLSMIEDAEKKDNLKPGATVVEPTSGNTGIGLALVCAVKGYKCILTMPESMSLERIYILKSYGAEVVLTPAIEGMSGAIKKAEEIVKKTKNSFMPQQFNNPANPEVHRRTTAQEILLATDGKLDAFVAGVGTGGTITGVGEVLKKKNHKIKIVAVEPSTSAVLSGKSAGPHKIQGIGAGFIPNVLNREIIDEIVTVEDDEAFRISKRLAREEGLFVGISAGAAVFGALKVAKDLGKGKRIVVILPDTGERYFSMEQYYTT